MGNTGAELMAAAFTVGNFQHMTDLSLADNRIGAEGKSTAQGQLPLGWGPERLGPPRSPPSQSPVNTSEAWVPYPLRIRVDHQADSTRLPG
jgi:hypothetical protein